MSVEDGIHSTTKPWNFIPTHIVDEIFKHCNLDEIINCVTLFPLWRLAMPKTLKMPENSTSYFDLLVQLSSNVGLLHISLSDMGPSCPGGALNLFLNCLLQQTDWLKNIVSLDLSRQCQNISNLLKLFATKAEDRFVSPFTSLRFLSVRPIPDFVSESGLRNSVLIPPPVLEELHIHICGSFKAQMDELRNLIILAQNVIALAVCEEFCTKNIWRSIFEEAESEICFYRTNFLRLSDGSGLQDFMLSLTVLERRKIFPRLTNVFVDVFFWNRSHRNILSRINSFKEYNLCLCDETVSTRAKCPCANTNKQIYILNAVDNCIVPILHRSDRNLSIFLNTSCVLDKNFSYDDISEIELIYDQVGCLGISSPYADTMSDARTFMEHCNKVGIICRNFLLKLLKKCEKKLEFISINQQIIAACTLNQDFRDELVTFRGRFPYVKTIHIMGSVYAVSHAYGSQTWAGLRHFCGLFPNLECLRITFMYGLDATDLCKAVTMCKQLKVLYVHRVTIEQKEFQDTILEILSSSHRLEQLSLILGQIPFGEDIRPWTRAFKSSTLRYLHLELCAGGEIFLQEAKAIFRQMKVLQWLVIKCNDSHIIEMHRTSPHKEPTVRELLRLETLDLQVLYPQLFGLFWFRNTHVSYYHFQNYTACHFERIL